MDNHHHNLSRLLNGTGTPAPDEARQARAREKALAAFRYAELHREEEAPAAGLLFWRRLAVGLVALVLLQAAVLMGWFSTTPDPASPQAALAMLHEMEDLFPGQQVVVIQKDGTMTLDLTQDPLPHDDSQRILVELRKGDQRVAVYTYSGRSTCLELAGRDVCLTPLLQGSGEPMLMTQQEVVAAGQRSRLDGYRVELTVLKEGRKS